MAIVSVKKGQMTVEFVALFPVAIVVALIAVNAVLFFSECASFDRVFRTSVCTYAASPSYGQGVDESCALIQAQLEEVFDADHLQVTVSSSGTSGSMVAFTGTLSFAPTLFGQGALTGIFGVSFPSLVHEERIAVDVYKPGVIL